VPELPGFKTYCLFVAAAGLALLLCACGATHKPVLEASTDTGSGQHTSPSSLEAAFDPTRICVIYRGDAEFRSLPAELQALSAQAGQRSNAILRPRSGFERLSDSLAEHYGMELLEQIYYGRVLVAGFRLPDNADGAALLQDIRRTYADFIAEVDYSQLYSPAFSPDDPEYIASGEDSGGQWNLKHMRIESAWVHTLGDPSILLSVVDTGVNMTHAEFGSALLDPAVEFPGTNCDIANDDASIEDHHGHGTFISGQIIAESDNASGIAGAAPGIRLFPVKISEAGTNESLERIMSGCILAHALGAKIISLSWGGGGNEAMRLMTEDFAADEVLLVSSAGNYGNTFVTFPGAYPDAMAIGNVVPDDGRYVTSSYGPAVDLVAPGWNLSSLSPSDDNALIKGGTGTSYATPLVSAAAALLWSMRPELSLPEMRGLLETSGPEAWGFGEGVHVRRLDIGTLFERAVNPRMSFRAPNKIVQAGSMQLEFDLRGEPDVANLALDGKPVSQLSGPDWGYTLSLAGVSGGLHQLSVHAVFGTWETTETLDIYVAGPALQFPLAEHFSEGFGICTPLDLSQYNPLAMQLLSMQEYSGVEEQFRELGIASWYIYEIAGPVQQNQVQIGADGFGQLELDALLTQPVHVPDTARPTLALEHRCNVSEALQRILISDDYGLSWQEALNSNGDLPSLGGFILPHTQIILDLAPYAGEDVIVMFLLAAESDSTAIWQQFTWGWWLDVLSFGEDGWLDLPVVALADSDLLFGRVPGKQSLSVAPAFEENIALASWWLDFPAWQIDQKPDLRVTVSGSGQHGYVFDLSGSAYTFENRIAQLHLILTDIHGNVTEELKVPVHQYNKAGDVNADGLVDAADTAALQQQLSAELPYMPFFDCNLDGLIDERDGAVIAYSYGN
jgi:hypothetical protein